MAQTLETLIRRTDTLNGIRSIVHTMKTLSAINALPYEQAARAIDIYREVILDGLQAFLHHNGSLAWTPQDAASQIIIAFGSDHGLCGNYNEILAAAVAKQAKLQTPSGNMPQVICVGAHMENALTDMGIQTERSLFPPATADGLGRLAGDLVTRLDDIRGNSPSREVEVTLVFTERAEHGRQAPVTQRLLPLDTTLLEDLAHRPWKSRSLPLFNLPPDELLASLIRDYLFASMFRAAAEALVTENTARLSRMQQAEQSVDERLETLKFESQMARQSAITNELLDIIIGFEALKGRERRHSRHQRSIIRENS